MGYIDRIRDRLRVRDVSSSSTGDVRAPTDLPPDHHLTFRRGPNEEWKYREGRILVNEIDIEDVLDYESRDVRLWCSISGALVEYKNEVLKREGVDKAHFVAKVGAIHDKILGNMRKLYDEKMDGFYLSLGDGEVLLNNFNVRAFLAMYHMMPTGKARKFLLGLKAKLALILVNRNGTPQYERVHRVIQRLYEEVLGALDIPPIETCCLPPSDRHRSL